ncbi:hypothetical protein E4U53_002044 [Claviceps sorghi]|nr:hypothetical protein E4U53_002044 [Claviceps sorghi]
MRRSCSNLQSGQGGSSSRSLPKWFRPGVFPVSQDAGQLMPVLPPGWRSVRDTWPKASLTGISHADKGHPKSAAGIRRRITRTDYPHAAQEQTTETPRFEKQLWAQDGMEGRISMGVRGKPPAAVARARTIGSIRQISSAGPSVCENGHGLTGLKTPHAIQ